MASIPDQRNKSSLVLIALAGMILLVILVAYKFLATPDKPPSSTDRPDAAARDEAATPPAESSPGQVIEYGKLESDGDLKNMMDARKKAFDVGEGIDIIARSDETLQIGDNRVSMKELQDQIRLKLGEISEENLGPDGQPLPVDPETYGIHVVRPGDNIWNIHFAFLKDYFKRRGVDLARSADEPDRKGYSSGVGKLLKFSENMVYIYNVKEKDFSQNLNLIEPNSKIVVYKMDQVFQLLEQIDYRYIDQLQFDGDTLWIPAG
ncbi:MAG: hypothetical protein QNJ04_10770 [Desulfobacterales bacterium]|nr:hypothetical protein [Desulfobacterales bacterium]